MSHQAKMSYSGHQGQFSPLFHCFTSLVRFLIIRFDFSMQYVSIYVYIGYHNLDLFTIGAKMSYSGHQGLFASFFHSFGKILNYQICMRYVIMLVYVGYHNQDLFTIGAKMSCSGHQGQFSSLSQSFDPQYGQILDRST